MVAYELSDLAYAAEIAPLMLVRQQAQARFWTESIITPRRRVDARLACSVLDQKRHPSARLGPLTDRSPLSPCARQAIVDARRTIVHGAVNITSDAIQGLTDRGHAMAEGDKPKLITNLLTVICSEKSPVPTIDM